LVTPTALLSAHASAVAVIGTRSTSTFILLLFLSSPRHGRYAWADANSDETESAKNSVGSGTAATWVVSSIVVLICDATSSPSHRPPAAAASRYVMTTSDKTLRSATTMRCYVVTGQSQISSDRCRPSSSIYSAHRSYS